MQDKAVVAGLHEVEKRTVEKNRNTLSRHIDVIMFLNGGH